MSAPIRTLAELRAAIRGLGLHLTWSPDLGEYAVSVRYNGVLHARYFTDDRLDAWMTAREMAGANSPCGGPECSERVCTCEGGVA